MRHARTIHYSSEFFQITAEQHKNNTATLNCWTDQISSSSFEVSEVDQQPTNCYPPLVLYCIVLYVLGNIILTPVLNRIGTFARGMVLQVSAAAAEDVDEIAALHLAAFDTNALLHAQFPTTAALDGLQKYLSQEMLHTIEHAADAEKAVLVVRDTDSGSRIVGFSKWDLPGLRKDAPHSDITWPADCRQEYLDRYYELAEVTKDRVIGDKPCYRKMFHSVFLRSTLLVVMW